MKGKFSLHLLTLFLLLCVMALQPAAAQEDDSDQWHFGLAPYLWMTNITGDISVGSITLPVDISFGDLFADLKFGGAFHFEAGKGRWAGIFDMTYVHVGDTVEIAQGAPLKSEAEYNLKMFVIEALGTYCFVLSPKASLELLGGIRYMGQDQDTSITVGPFELGGSYDESWLDPVAGVRLIADLSPRFVFIARADIGGFGLGSDLTLNANAGLGFRLSSVLDILLEYKIMDITYDNGKEETRDFFALDATLHGFLLGVNFHF